jgi:hypothetical protein
MVKWRNRSQRKSSPRLLACPSRCLIGQVSSGNVRLIVVEVVVVVVVVVIVAVVIVVVVAVADEEVKTRETECLIIVIRPR